MPLAAKLGLSRTGFYWHFADREALLAGLIARWESRNTAVLLEHAAKPAATIAEAMLNIIDCWITPEMFDARLEFAIRTWAQTDVVLARVLAQTDELRIQALNGLYLRFGFDGPRRQHGARAVYLTQVGYIAMQTEEDLAERLERIPYYALIFGGRQPTAKELAAFQRRHENRL